MYDMLDRMSQWYCCHGCRTPGFGAIDTSMRNRTMTHAAPRVRMPGGYREVVCLALPVVVSMLTQTLTSAVESAFLGRFGTVEQGAAGLGGALLWPILIACNCSGLGCKFVSRKRWARSAVRTVARSPGKECILRGSP